MFTRLLFFWVTWALLLSLNCGTASEEDEDVTPTPDYDYNFTLEYYNYNGAGSQGNMKSVYRYFGILAGLLVVQICQQT